MVFADFSLFSGARPGWQPGGSVRIRGCRQGQRKQKGFGLVGVKAPEGIFL